MRGRSILVFALVCLVAKGAWAGEHGVPDPKLTPGQALPNLTQADICAPSFNKTARAVPFELQRKIFASYGLPGGNRTSYCETADGCTINRLIPPSLGGTNDPRNLWPLPHNDHVWNVRAKTQLEEKLRDMVCKGELSLTEAQNAIATDWITTYQTLIGEPPPDDPNY